MKKFIFGLMATTLLGVFSIYAQSSGKPQGYQTLDRLGFGRISSYAGPCLSGPGMCSGAVDNTLNFAAGIAKVSETSVSYAFSREFYQANLQYLENGLNIGVNYAIPQSVSSKIGITGEFIVARGLFQVTERDGFYFVSIPREQH